MEVRILVDTAMGGIVLPCNAALDVPDAMAADLVAMGVGDTAPEAVAYAKTLDVAAPELPTELLAAYAPAPAPTKPAK